MVFTLTAGSSACVKYVEKDNQDLKNHLRSRLSSDSGLEQVLFTGLSCEVLGNKP